MRVGIVVDGQSEFRSLRSLIERAGSPVTLLKPLYADLQPHSSCARIVAAAMPSLRVLQGRHAERVLILLDHETRSDCPGGRAGELETAFGNECGGFGFSDVRVVVKMRTYENWLVSDPDGVNSLRGRFALSAGAIRRIQPNKGDHVDGRALLQRACHRDYDKVSDAVRLTRIVDAGRVATNSRSFRRLLRLLDHPTYAEQSRLPAA